MNDLREWERVRRFAVPRWMIERATERRLAGDWRGACAAANVDVGFELADVAREYGAETAGALEDELRHLAPDLLRWHLPRSRETTRIRSGQALLLSRCGDAHLYALTRTDIFVPIPQRFQLLVFRELPWRYGDSGRLECRDWSGLRPLWDARRAGDLLACRGGGDRAPFLRPDGTPLADGELPTRDPGPDDPVARTEWTTLLHERGDLDAALATVGMVLADRKGSESGPFSVADVTELDLPLLAREARALAEAEGTERVRTDVILWGGSLMIDLAQDVLSVWTSNSFGPSAPMLPDVRWRRLPDIDLLRAGRITPEELHPLVRDALCPARPPADGPVGPRDPEPGPVRVHCLGERHEARWRDGDLDIPHPAEERERERAARALGAPSSGCFTLRELWRGGEKDLPADMQDQREEMFMRLQHGDAPGVLRMLDAGVDPCVRDGDGRTLLHGVYLADHEILLPRLLAAGLDPRAGDHRGATPLFFAVNHQASAECVRALMEAGARAEDVPHTPDMLEKLKSYGIGT